MNSNKSSGENEAMDKVLGQWKVDSPLPPRFQEQVWQRIAKAETKPEPLEKLGWWRVIEVALLRPRFAYAYLGLLLAVGVAAGSWTAQLKSNRMDSELRMRYVQSIDPYLADNSQP